jgi:hypothetical protein
MTAEQKASLERLLAAAQGHSGQARRVADFLLAWWNAGSCGGFDLTNPWGVDRSIVEDMVIVFGYIARTSAYPDNLGFSAEFQSVVRGWRPELAD